VSEIILLVCTAAGKKVIIGWRDYIWGFFMRIRDEQMDAMKVAALDSFEARMVQHTMEYFPDKAKCHGEEGLRRIIRHGVLAAKKYGLIAEMHVAKYIDLLIVLSFAFASRENHSWADAILNRDDLDATDKLETLLKEMRKAGRSESRGRP